MDASKDSRHVTARTSVRNNSLDLWCGCSYSIHFTVTDWCTAALGLGYDSILSFENHEIITCGGECGTVPLGGACPPIRLHQDYRASEDCHCSDDPFQPCTKKELHALRLSNCSYLNCGYLDSTGLKRDTYQYLVNADNQAINPKSIRDGKCIMEGPIVEPPLSYSMDIIFTSNLLADHALVETAVQRLIVADGRSVVVLNMDRRPNLSFGFGRNENDMGASRAAVDAFLNASPLHVRLVGHHVQKHRSGSSRDSSDQTVHLYTNMAGFKNPTLLRIGNITIGIIVHESVVLRQEIISMSELMVWIIKVRCSFPHCYSITHSVSFSMDRSLLACGGWERRRWS